MSKSDLATAATAAAPVLEARSLVRRYAGLGRRARTAAALDDVTVALWAGVAVAIVGESGSGKSTLARLLLRLEEPDGGKLLLDGRSSASVDERSFRRRVQLVFQDPYSSLDPMRTVGEHLFGPLVRLAGVAADAWCARASALLEEVGLSPADQYLGRLPHELSGGQRQRVAIARALAASPDVLIADEPTSMLDVSMRVGVLDVFARRKTQGLALALITHDLGAAARIADRVVVLFRGRVVEEGPFHEVLRAPAHPYTRSLVDALESLDAPAAPTLPATDGERGCAYAARCPHAVHSCVDTAPVLSAFDGDGRRRVRCFLPLLHERSTASPTRNP